MSLRAAPSAPIPAETVRIAHAAFPKGTLCMQMRDTLGPLYDDHQFVALFSSTGPAGRSPRPAGAGAGAAVCRRPVGPPSRGCRPRADRLEICVGLGADRSRL